MFLDLLRETTTGELESGTEVRFNCPFCGDERQKFYVQNEDPYLWHCKYCDRHGNPITFVKEFYGVSFIDAKEILEGYDYYVGDTTKTNMNSYSSSELTEAEQLFLLISGSSDEAAISENEPLKAVDLPKGFKLLKDNVDNREAFPYFNYLLKRNIIPAMAFYYDIGYVDEGTYYNPNKGSESRLTHSIVFITKDDKKNSIYWSTRAITPDAYVKSLNAPVMEGYYSKRNTIFNLYEAVKTGSIIISEGIFNAITTGQSGVATFGKQITEDQVKLLESEYDKNKLLKFYVFLDNDAKEQSLSLASRLYEFTDSVYLVVNPYVGKDANDLGFEKTRDLVNAAIKYEPNSISELLLLTN